VAGFIVAWAEGAEGHIITIDVLEEHRRAGVGTALLQAMEQRLAARGVRRVGLETATSNESGVAFWEHHGYRKTGVMRGYYLGRHDAWKMSKALGEAMG
jgi:ribosomal protein S18 acetylase RimI-like enzyme